jgi:histidine triad (HIT) family protein
MTAYDSDNIFAKILRGEIPCNKIYEDDYAIAFHDIAPKAPVHVLVIPKKPYVSIVDFTQAGTPEEIAGFYKAFGNVVKQLGVEDGGFRTIANTGLNGGQEVPHFHLHILAGRVLGPMVNQ